MSYAGKKVLVTGGLGFIGSNLAIRLAEEGAEVVIVDSSVAGCGANLHNIAPVRDRVRLIPAAVCEMGSLGEALARTEVIFNLAGEISHTHSMEFPERDLQINAVAQLQFLLACRQYARGRRIVYAGTRQVYGAPEYLPVDESHPVNPIDFNGVHKAAATTYHLLMSRSGDLDAVVLRLTNVYGPRMALNIPCQGFLSNFLRRLLLGQTVEIYGDGNQLRDPMFVDDAVEAFLRAGEAQPLPARIYNVGGPEALSLAEVASLAVAAAGAPGPVYRPFPEHQKAIDIGSYYTDWTRIQRELGWVPQMRFAEGIRRTIEYYRRELPHYLASAADPTCDLPEHIGFRRRLRYHAL
ncbi:MAG: NAD-dependent epimerase/dehydratase family protein [Acidobacteria bacterium]|nr:NAD-dependent epimerase/dehydratase family protein [Acidobacteriota bacterium]